MFAVARQGTFQAVMMKLPLLQPDWKADSLPLRAKKEKLLVEASVDCWGF